jgi:hypothetical protein
VTAASAARLLLPIIVLSLLRLWLASGQMLTAFSHATADDRLFLSQAWHLAEGRWLGSFDHLTLVKGPFYPMWIAAGYILGVPLQLSQNVLYITACVVTILALRPVVRSSAALVAIYAVLLFNPVTFGIHRVLREGVYIPLTLLLAAFLIGLFFRRTTSMRSLAIWAGGAGLALSGMWLAREESIWILPSMLFILAAAAFSQWRRGADRLGRRYLLLISPFAILLASIALVSAVNRAHYGVFLVTETAASDWLAAYGALSRVEHDSWRRYAPVPRHVRERIYRASPAFSELRSVIEGDLGRLFTSYGCVEGRELCSDVSAGWFMFLLREAASTAGYYRSAPIALAYYRRLANEVNAACAVGTLRCGPPRATMRPSWRQEYGPLLLVSLARATTRLVRFEGISAYAWPSVGDEVTLQPFQLITRDRLAPSAARLRVNGWGFSPNGDLRIEVQDSTGITVASETRWIASPDVFDHFVAQEGRPFVQAHRARFSLTAPCLGDCRLIIRAHNQDGVLGTVPVGGNGAGRLTPELRFHIEGIAIENDLLGSGRLPVDSVKLKILTRLISFYAKGGPILAGLLVITLVVAPIAFAFGHRSALLVPIVTVAGAVIARIVLIAVIDATSFPSLVDRYLGPAHGLLLLAGLLACVELWSVGRVWGRSRLATRRS